MILCNLCFSISASMDINPWRGLSGSESDYSDTENSGVANKLQSYQSRVRQHSLSALFSILKVIFSGCFVIYTSVAYKFREKIQN